MKIADKNFRFKSYVRFFFIFCYKAYKSLDVFDNKSVFVFPF